MTTLAIKRIHNLTPHLGYVSTFISYHIKFTHNTTLENMQTTYISNKSKCVRRYLTLHKNGTVMLSSSQSSQVK